MEAQGDQHFEITGMEKRHQHAGDLQLHQKGIGPDGKVIGSFIRLASAQVPRTAAHRGSHLPPSCLNTNARQLRKGGPLLWD